MTSNSNELHAITTAEDRNNSLLNDRIINIERNSEQMNKRMEEIGKSILLILNAPKNPKE